MCAGERTVLHTARARSPLKLLLPSNHGRGAWAYVATLGGGLVDGDEVALSVEVDRGACALLGTQSSTKVYRSPRGTAQNLCARVGTGALLAVLPDPVSCFAGARYAQTLDVELEDGDATLVLVDALTCGRAARGERWAFARYASRIRVSRAGRCAIHDATLLDPRHGAIAARMGRLEALATVIAVGARAHEVRERMIAAAASPASRSASRLASVATPLPDVALARVAGSSVEEVGAAVRSLVEPIAAVLGDDPFARRW